jgi:PAS domain S-box-containing protein
MIKNLLNDERYYFKAFIKTVQYLATLTTQKGIMIHVEKLIKKFYNSDFFAFYECGADGTIIEHRNKISNALISKKALAKIEETTIQVLESGFFGSELINPPDPYAMVFLPISKANQIISVIVIGHRYSERLPKYLLNIYLALGGLIGTTIEKLTMIQELRTQHSKLKENDRFLTNIFTSIKDGICVIDKDYSIIRVNPTMKNWYSYMEPLLGKKCYQVFMNRTEQCKVCRLDELFKTNKPFQKIIPRKGNRGENLGILEVYTFPLHDLETGKSTGAIEYIRDITERRKAEQQLKESEAKVKTLNDIYLEFTDDPLKNIQLLVDAAGKLLMSDCAGYNKIINVNGKKKLKNIAIWQEPPEFEREENPIGRICTDVINMNKDDILILKDLDKTSYSKTDPKVLKYNLKQYCGIVVRLNNEPVAAFCVIYKKNRDMSESDKNIIRILSKSASIEEQRFYSYQKIRESEAKYRNLFESSPNVIVLLNLNGKIIDVNPATLTQYGFERKDFIDKDFRELNTFLPGSLPILVKKFKGLLTKGVLEPIELPFYTKGGNIIWVNLQGSLVKIGGETYIQTVIQDINERKEAEEELINLHNLRSELISRTSHELKTPLTSIKGFTELLMTLIKDKIDDNIFSNFDNIIRGINRLENLINSVIKTSELSTGAIKLNKTYENLSSLINLSIKDLESFDKLRNHTITVDIHDYLTTKFEKEQILHVLNNLISNATKYTPPNGKIEIKSQIKEKFYIISIKDNGIGFTQDEKNRIFKRFGKIEHFGKGLDVYSEGSGLGLYISKKIIELHDGNIWMESEGRNKGSTFYFSLPIIK